MTIHYAVRVHTSARGLLHDRLTGPADSTCTSNVGGMLGPECVVETEIVPPPTPPPAADLAVSKTPSTDTVHPGGQLQFTLAVHNLGPSDATGVTLEDPVPAGLSLNTAEASQGSCTVTPGEAVRCRLGDLPAGGQALVVVTATVPLDATGELVNAATVFGDQGDPNPANNDDRARVSVEPLPPPPTPDAGPEATSDLRVAKHVSHPTARVGQKLTYTITVTNKGPDPASDVRLIDTPRLPLRVVSTQASHGCQGGQPIRCRLGTLASGAHATITITATATKPGRQVNAAMALSGSWDPNPRTALAVANTRILAAPRKTHPRPPHHRHPPRVTRPHHPPKVTG